jgi:hypothetical protein
VTGAFRDVFEVVAGKIAESRAMEWFFDDSEAEAIIAFPIPS